MEVEQGPPVRRPVFSEAEDSPVRKLHPSVARRHVTPASARPLALRRSFGEFVIPWKSLRREQSQQTKPIDEMACMDHLPESFGFLMNPK
jgi:hypothetical protein